MNKETEVIIIGAGTGGLVLALSLHQIGVACRVYEAVSDIQAIGAGINLLPHAVRELDELDLVPELDRVGIRTKDASYYNHHGQFIYRELAGEAAGYDWPQFSIHRGDVQQVLLKAVRDRLGQDAVVTGHRCVGVEQDGDGATAYFTGPQGQDLAPARARIVVGCDGIKSAVRRQFLPDEGEPVYAGITIWRGVTPFKPFLSGADTIRAGWMSVGKLMVYPIREQVDADGNQLLNFVASLERPKPERYDWNRFARHEDFVDAYMSWTFDWLDVPALLLKAEPILMFPMVDRDPVSTWTFGRVTLLGDAAHPMYPRGSNGAGQAILDARYMAGCFKRKGVTVEALREYDEVRVAATAKVVRMNRAAPPDTILRVVYERTQGKPFNKIDDVISQAELKEISEQYKRAAGFDIEFLRTRPSYVL
ncbi:flavin-dependent oxidoreductase [Pigmentiphaga sp.]|uniref:flavin-dependent oxidoreductase n=1 Tax=Pigmentiphaga sp. TaxID=1977564 RepID=UPI00128D529D|nr:flavin-dependent oxidoreductase [Pigmentiphaga sp.]MPS25262.1 flavin-dependent oxidoreductase [Alcaligenaceae bacterium SAGV5]MPS53929.1 flavin-dependent oxidoreductase [Alcaligenaceae bacterium SAGV3]MPT59077.1 flavin-dependent oxidoreductase [Alcaligenaceae bacterium]